MLLLTLGLQVTFSPTAWRDHASSSGDWVSTKAVSLIDILLNCFRIKVHFKDSKGNHLKTIEANEGDDLLSIAHEHDIDLEGARIQFYFNSEVKLC